MPEFIAIDTETTGLKYRHGDRAFMVLATNDTGREYLWRFDVDPFTRKVHYCQKTAANIASVLSSYRTWIFHNATFDIPILSFVHKYFKSPNLFKRHEIHDTQLIGHHFSSLEKRGLKERALLHIDYRDDDEGELNKAVAKARTIAGQKGWMVANAKNTPYIEENFAKADYWIPGQLAKKLKYPSDHPWHHLCPTYGIGDVRRTAGLYIFYKEALPQDQWEIYEKHRHLIPVIIDMENRGVHLLLHEIAPTQKHFESRAASFLKTLRILAEDENFNPRSPIQLKRILFDKYKFEPTKFAKTGPSTDKDVLADLAQLDPSEVYDDEGIDFVNTLIQYRQGNTTIGFLKNYARHAINEILHASYHQVGTSTVRISISDPNTQNVGKKDNPFGTAQPFKLRRVFGPPPDRIWYCGDYDQFQIRIFATAANDSYLLRAFEQGIDCHHAVACKMFRTETPTDLQRRAAKYVNFGIIFGAGQKRIESLAGIDGAYDLFAVQFPKVFQFLQQSSATAKRTGFVHTLGGYRLQVPRGTPYAAANYIIQGTEGEIVKLAMIRVYEKLKRSRMKMFLQVHDELVFDAPVDYDATRDLKCIQTIMVEESERLGIPASVDFKSTTTNWADVTPYQLDNSK